ncbi:hypothetical protein EGW08_001974 [Elysia chlorotica]|uniref:Gem-associated protein 8 n=1 Tax=Elysia chlorotica TaxID=188477 RepID=A0A433U8W3_ELYCH|nr:hypothetical protein EGW08_001974 [Elysia chlorotica]
MAEKGHTSSITSVTEYDSSIDSESDTTESSNSNVTSSLLSSTDTDDKLTPSLSGISISASAHLTLDAQTNQTGIKRHQPSGTICDDSQKNSQDHKNPYTQPSKRLALHRTQRPQDKIFQSLLRRLPFSIGNFNQNADYNNDNMGIDDLDNKLSTDFSDTSSRAGNIYVSNKLSSTTSQDNDSEPSTEPSQGATSSDPQSQPGTQPWEPDMSSSQWYEAGCFSRYWSHYGFVMAWYRAHMDAVHRLHRDMQERHGTAGYQASLHCRGQRVSSSGRLNRRAKRRARNRRSAKAKRKAAKSADENEGINKKAGGGICSLSNTDKPNLVGEEDEMEMEITEDMMAFFKTSLKHRMERDNAKSGTGTGETECEARVNIEDACVGQAGPSTAPPQERPGARRAQEMKQLYGTGAPMIHGMETALQMTYDRTQDKFQPKLWPNMPLKIIFG